MSIQGVNSQRPAVQNFQTHSTGPAQQPATQQAQRQDPLAALTKALAALEQAVQSLSTKGFNNNQSVAQQASQPLGQSGNSTANSTANQFDWSSLLGGGSTFERQQPAPQPTFTPPAQQTQQRDTNFLNGSGGGAAPTHTNNGLHLGNEKSGGGGGVRIGSDGANN